MGLVPIGLGVSILFDAMQSLCNPDFLLWNSTQTQLNINCSNSINLKCPLKSQDYLFWKAMQKFKNTINFA